MGCCSSSKVVAANVDGEKAAQNRETSETGRGGEDGEDEKSSSEEEGESSDSAKRQPDLTWRWGIWQSRDARRAATSYTDQLLSHMPDSFRFQKEFSCCCPLATLAAGQP
eukprot:g2386.t2